MVPPDVDQSATIATAVALVGRDEERRVLRAALAQLSANGTATGASRHLALLGPAGAGKSRLARELTQAAAGTGVRTLVGRAVPGVGPTPYRPLREALLAWTRDGSAAGLDDRYADAIAPLLGPGPVVDPQTAQVSPVFVGEALLRTLTSASVGVVLVLEDLHWADSETVSAVEYLCDNASPARLLVLLTSRDEQPSEARDLVRRLVARGVTTALPLEALTARQTADLAEELFGAPVAPQLASALHERSDGVPLLVEELVAALRMGRRTVVEDGVVRADLEDAALLPASVADAVQARLATLGALEQQVLQTAAVLGRAVDPDRLERVTGRTSTEVLSALRAATALAVLEEDPDRRGGLRFRHALVRDAVELSAFPPERVRTARQALTVVLSGQAPEEVTGDEVALAFDLAARCDDRPVAVRLARRAASIAWDRWALSTAESWLARARRYADTDEQVAAIDLENLRVAATVGRLDVVDRLGRGLLGRNLGPHDELETRMRLAQVLLDDERFADGAEQLACARPLVESIDDPCMRTRHVLYSSIATLGAGDREHAAALADRAIRLAEPHDDERDLVCAALLQLGRSKLPDVEAARDAWTHALRLTDEYGYRLWRARMLAELATLSVPDLGGDQDLTVAALGAREAGAVELAQRIELLRAELALLRGRPTQAADHLAEAARSAPGTTVAAATRRRAAELAALLAAMHGQPATDDLPRRLSPEAWAVVQMARALASDDVGAAEELANQVHSAPNELGAALDAVASVSSPGHASAHCAGLARGVVGRAAARAHGALLSVSSDSAAAGDAVREAVDELAAAPWFAAVLARTCAPALIGAGAGASVRDPLRAATVTFDELGLTAPADACRAMLRQAGVPVPRRAVAQSGVPDRLASYGVTARELDVVLLVAEGLTSREIGERLYLSPRTVEKHVERLMVKTGSANRAALAALAGSPQVT